MKLMCVSDCRKSRLAGAIDKPHTRTRAQSTHWRSTSLTRTHITISELGCDRCVFFGVMCVCVCVRPGGDYNVARATLERADYWLGFMRRWVTVCYRAVCYFLVPRECACAVCCAEKTDKKGSLRSMFCQPACVFQSIYKRTRSRTAPECGVCLFVRLRDIRIHSDE